LSSAPRIKVLVAEDEEHLGVILSDYLTERGYAVHRVRDGGSALDALREQAFDVALLDLVMPEVDGLEVFRRLREATASPEVIIITGNGTVESAIAAMRFGAFDYLSKPYRLAEIDVLVRRAWERRELTRENARLTKRLARLDPLPEIVTQHQPLQEVLGLVARVAKSDSPVLITGESGTGKELIARALHRLSERGSGPLVDLNCEAIGGVNVELELFGYEGVANPSQTRRPGLLELAGGGTLFLDEVAGLEPRVQGALLRALEQRTFLRPGSTQMVEVNARLITATNRDLARLVSEERFRADLFYRINTISISLPPLRERPEDVPLLAQRFLAVHGGANPPSVTPAAMDMLRRYRWPGNVRELKNVIERAVLLAQNGAIDVRDLPLSALGPTQAPSAAAFVSLEEVERDHIQRVLDAVGWHQGRAASVLGISSKTLYRKIRDFGFKRPNGQHSD
jgi:two-component system, NtrC family, response regulator AtoC